MVIIIRCNDFVSDPRAMKYVRFLQEKGVEYRLIGWDRDGKRADIPHAVMWGKKAGYNVGGLHAVKNRIGWLWFVYRQLIKMGITDAVLHGCDIDSAFPAACYKIFHHKAKVIFDVFDWFSATLYNQKGYILKAFKMMEKVAIKQSDYVIICEPERIEQIPYEIPSDKLLLLPNIPYFNSELALKRNTEYEFDNDKITFSYVGGLSTERCLSEVLDIAAEGRINLLIAGFGANSIQEKIDSLRDCPNIRFFGKVKYEDGLQIMYNSDVIYAMYSICNPNHVYAAPNKFYEAMMLGKPLFTTKGTIVERKVNDLGIGYTSGETKEEIVRAIEEIQIADMKIKGEKALSLWKSKYSNYTEDFMKGIYSGII